jgi:hypothetical protein
MSVGAKGSPSVAPNWRRPIWRRPNWTRHRMPRCPPNLGWGGRTRGERRRGPRLRDMSGQWRRGRPGPSGGMAPEILNVQSDCPAHRLGCPHGLGRAKIRRRQRRARQAHGGADGAGPGRRGAAGSRRIGGGKNAQPRTGTDNQRTGAVDQWQGYGLAERGENLKSYGQRHQPQAEQGPPPRRAGGPGSVGPGLGQGTSHGAVALVLAGWQRYARKDAQEKNIFSSSRLFFIVLPLHTAEREAYNPFPNEGYTTHQANRFPSPCLPPDLAGSVQGLLGHGDGRIRASLRVAGYRCHGPRRMPPIAAFHPG